MASEVKAPIAVRGMAGIRATTSSPTADAINRITFIGSPEPADSAIRAANIVRAPEQSGVTWGRQQDSERPADQQTGKLLPQGIAAPQYQPTSIAETEHADASQERNRSSSSNQSNLNSAIAEMKRYVQSVQRDLQFEVDEESDRTIVRVVDSETGDVVRQIPAEEFLQMAKRMEELDGLLMSEHA